MSTLRGREIEQALTDIFLGVAFKGLARTIMYGVHMVFLAGKSPFIRSYTVRIYTVLANL